MTPADTKTEIVSTKSPVVPVHTQSDDATGTEKNAVQKARVSANKSAHSTGVTKPTKQSQRSPEKPWRPFAVAAAITITLILGFVPKVVPGGGQVFVVFANGTLSVAFGLVASAVVVALSKPTDLDGSWNTHRVRFVASGAIGAFILVSGASFWFLSHQLQNVREGDATRRTVAIDKVNQRLTEVGDTLPASVTGDTKSLPAIDQSLDEVEAVIADLETKSDTSPEFRHALGLKKKLVAYFRGAAEYLRGRPDEAIKLIKGLSGEVAAKANFDLLRARCHMKLRQWTQAADAMAVVKQMYSKDATIRFWVGMCQFRCGDFEQAYETFSSVSTGKKVFVTNSDDRPVYATSLLYKMFSHRFARDRNHLQFSRSDQVDADVKHAASMFEQLISDPDQSRKETELWRVALAEVYHLAAWLVPPGSQRTEYFLSAISRFRELFRDVEDARFRLAMTLMDRGAIAREQRQRGDAYRDYLEAAGILDDLEHLPAKQPVYRELIAQAHLNAGEMALTLGPTQKAAPASHFRRTIELISSESSLTEQLVVMRGRARSGLMVTALTAERPVEARKLASEVEADLGPLEQKRSGDSELATALVVARKVLKAIPPN